MTSVIPKQTAYQKNKSTLINTFTLRLLFEIAKKEKIKLFIGIIDLEKAFDKVNRRMLFLRLASLGIGSTMLAAIISMYSNTSCCLFNHGSIQEPFYTYTGVKQGAATSAILFIIYIDENKPPLSKAE